MAGIKYQVITESYHSGEDAKQDADTLKEAIGYAKEWMRDIYYHSAKIYLGMNLIRHYIRTNNKIKNIIK